MKIVKFLLVFVIILGGVVGAFWLIGGSTGYGLDEPSDDTYQTYRKQFENDWKNKGDWSDSLFSAHCDMVRMLSMEYNVAPLKDLMSLIISCKFVIVSTSFPSLILFTGY